MLCSAVMVTAILCARCMCCRCVVRSDCLTVRPFCLADCFRNWLRCPGVTPCRVCLVWLRLLWLSRLGCLCLLFSLVCCMRKGSARFIPCRAFCVCPSMNFRRVWFACVANPYPLPLFFGRCVGVRCSRACLTFGGLVFGRNG